MEAEILKFLPWGTLLAMLGVVAYVARTAMNYSRTAESAAAAKAKSDVIERELGAFRLEVASKYVQADALRSMRDEISASMNRLGDRLDRIVELSQSRSDRSGPPRT
ncbi:hypothetical protein [Aureimonas sp. SK2]|uniref:hypothetical protein n=1 Tax=Aureimonas sp. SK2 TaxID=3015992 RepID=UPI002443D411|nr:hypothetical protein [Aureimonas sp. SK2]